jgi:hypothetical protein
MQLLKFISLAFHNKRANNLMVKCLSSKQNS